MVRYLARKWHNYWLTWEADGVRLWVDAFHSPPDSTWVWATKYAESLDYLAQYPTDRLILNGAVGEAVALWLVEHPAHTPIAIGTRTPDPAFRAKLNFQIQKAKSAAKQYETVFRYKSNLYI